jgi:hypothetical protein
MSSGKPVWRQAFDGTERAVGRPLERITTSSAYADLLAMSLKARRAVVGTVADVAGSALGGILRAANVPTREDVLRLSHQFAVLAGEVRAVAAAQHNSGRAKHVESAPKPVALERAEGNKDG